MLPITGDPFAFSAIPYPHGDWLALLAASCQGKEILVPVRAYHVPYHEHASDEGPFTTPAGVVVSVDPLD